jgi:predicted enzyme related to lactoylglutathione lyase
MRFAGVCLITSRVRASAEFYEKVLGAKAEGDETHMSLSVGNTDLAIFSTEGMEGMAPGSTRGAGHGGVTIGFTVEDVDAEYERLKALGVEFLMLPTTHPWGWRSFFFRDPDGNIIVFNCPAKGGGL